MCCTSSRCTYPGNMQTVRYTGEGLQISAEGTVVAEPQFVLGGATLIASASKIILIYHVQPSPVRANIFLKCPRLPFESPSISYFSRTWIRHKIEIRFLVPNTFWARKKILCTFWMLRYLYFEIRIYLHLTVFYCSGLRNLKLVRDVDAFWI